MLSPTAITKSRGEVLWSLSIRAAIPAWLSSPVPKSPMAMNLILSFAGVAPKTARGKTAAPAVIVAIDNNACRLVSRPLFFSSILLAIYILRSKVARFRARRYTNWRRNPDGIGLFLSRLLCRCEGETELLVNRNILSVGLECPAGASERRKRRRKKGERIITRHGLRAQR